MAIKAGVDHEIGGVLTGELRDLPGAIAGDHDVLAGPEAARSRRARPGTRIEAVFLCPSHDTFATACGGPENVCWCGKTATSPREEQWSLLSDEGRALRGGASQHSRPVQARCLSFPLVLRGPGYAWWQPVAGVLLMLVGALIVVPVVLMPALAVAITLQGGRGSFGHRFASSMQVDAVTPASMLYLNLTLASLTVLAMVIVRVVHKMSPRWLTSVLPGMRWRFFVACLGAGVLALAASQSVQALLPGDAIATSGQAALPTGQLLATTVVILLTTPLQALGEEYGFRGYLMQAIGSLFLSRVAALVGTSLLFAFAHGVQNAPLFLDRFTFGLMAGLAVILLGGLEAGIALHILNNLVAFGIAIAYDQVGSALNVTVVSWWQLPVTVVQNGVFLLLALLIARRMGLSNRTAQLPS